MNMSWGRDAGGQRGADYPTPSRVDAREPRVRSHGRLLEGHGPQHRRSDRNRMEPVEPLQPTDHVTVSPAAEFVLKPDPGHAVMDTNTQLFSNPNGPPAVGQANAGFIWSYSQRNPPPPDAASIMKCFDPARLPVLTALAREFALCDAWFSSVPGPTWPNRFFAHAATSKGFITNSQFNNYDMPTIFENLATSGLTWRDYYHDFSQTWALQRLQTADNRVNFASIGQFKKDARNGT